MLLTLLKPSTRPFSRFELFPWRVSETRGARNRFLKFIESLTYTREWEKTEVCNAEFSCRLPLGLSLFPLRKEENRRAVYFEAYFAKGQSKKKETWDHFHTIVRVNTSVRGYLLPLSSNLRAYCMASSSPLGNMNKSQIKSRESGHQLLKRPEKSESCTCAWKPVSPSDIIMTQIALETIISTVCSSENELETIFPLFHFRLEMPSAAVPRATIKEKRGERRQLIPLHPVSRSKIEDFEPLRFCACHSPQDIKSTGPQRTPPLLRFLLSADRDENLGQSRLDLPLRNLSCRRGRERGRRR